jgi:hypothetical protein
MSKTFGDKMESGDKVIVRTWAYALSVRTVQGSAKLMPNGSKGTIDRVVGTNAVVIRYSNGLLAPVHSSAVYPDR